MPVDIDRVRRAANTHKVRKWLIHYFLNKVGKQNIDRVIDPSSLGDLTIEIGPLHTKLEVVPNAIEMGLQDDQIALEWNLFVLGNKRMYLGQTRHKDIMNTLSMIKLNQPLPRIHGIEYGTTPKRIMTFILRILENHKDGYVHWVDPERSIDQVLGFGMLNSGYYHSHGLPHDVFR